MKLTGVITVPFHIGDFLSGTMHMDTLEKGAYIMLLLAHYQAGECGLVNDDKQLSRICGVTPKVWKRIRPILAQKFTVTETHWKKSKIIDVLNEVHEKSQKQRERALKKNCPKVDEFDSQRETNRVPIETDKSLKNKDTDTATAQPRHSQPKPKPNIDTKVSIDSFGFSIDGCVYSVDMLFESLWNDWRGIRVSSGRVMRDTGKSFHGTKSEALKRFKEQIRKEKQHEWTDTAVRILRSAKQYCEMCDNTDSPTKHVSTFLHGGHWREDYNLDGVVENVRVSGGQGNPSVVDAMSSVLQSRRNNQHGTRGTRNDANHVSEFYDPAIEGDRGDLQ